MPGIIPIPSCNMRANLFCFIILILLSESLIAKSFQIREQNPLSLIFGLPLQSSSVIDSHTIWSSDILLTVSNTYNPQAVDSERLIIDGETSVLDILFFRRYSEQLKFGLHLPLISHSSGGLDNFIINYHDALGFPQGDRLQGSSHQLLFQYIRNGVTILDKRNESSGLGDARILADYKLMQTRQLALAAHASLKLPTGDSDKLTGSGATDFSAWLSGDYQYGPRWHSSWYTGLLWMGQGEVLQDQQNKLAAFLGASLAWELSPAITLQIQADWHSALYENTEAKLLGPSLSLTTGGWIKMGLHDELAIAVMEDIDVGSAPDVQLHLGWNHKF